MPSEEPPPDVHLPKAAEELIRRASFAALIRGDPELPDPLRQELLDLDEAISEFRASYHVALERQAEGIRSVVELIHSTDDPAVSEGWDYLLAARIESIGVLSGAVVDERREHPFAMPADLEAVLVGLEEARAAYLAQPVVAEQWRAAGHRPAVLPGGPPPASPDPSAPGPASRSSQGAVFEDPMEDDPATPVPDGPDTVALIRRESVNVSGGQAVAAPDIRRPFGPRP